MAGKKQQAELAQVTEHATPLELGSGPVGVLLSHGFTGSPWPMKPWAEALADAGYRVSVPLLPGHGTTWQELNRTRWTDWYAGLERAFNALSEECEQVFVGGLSMGGALAVRLAETRGDDVAGLMLVNPALTTSDKRFMVLPALSKVKASIPAIGGDIRKENETEYAYTRTPLKAAASMMQLWRDVCENLRAVDQPILLFRSLEDHVVDPTSARVLKARAASVELTEIELANSYHVATLDHDAPLIFAESIKFLDRHRTGHEQ